jgi:dipeptidyl aminopeptidase/acylaminoacyl peptidase
VDYFIGIVYPDERHGLRGAEASLHFEVLMFTWLKERFA